MFQPLAESDRKGIFWKVAIGQKQTVTNQIQRSIQSAWRIRLMSLAMVMQIGVDRFNALIHHTSRRQVNLCR